jgi:hypothetical protein
MDHIKNTAFISGLSRGDIEELGPDFDFQTINETEQGMWNYVFFLHYLKKKDDDDFTGGESYIAGKVEDGDVSWLPNRCTWLMQVHDQAEAADDQGSKIFDRVASQEQKLTMLDAKVNEILKYVREQSGAGDDDDGDGSDDDDDDAPSTPVGGRRR